MNDMRFYRKWLHLEVSEGGMPNYYEVLGLANAEPNLQTIRAALEEKMDCLCHVNPEENIEAYARISGRVLEARHTLLDSVRKLAYDTDLLATRGGRAWKSYQRPSLWVRCQQIGLITIGFALGCCIMVMMAIMAERNPDGSIAYRPEVKAEKPKPFTTPLELMVYRPTKARDFQETGYVVMPSQTETEQETEAEVFALTSTGEAVPEEKAEDLMQALLPDSIADTAKNKAVNGTASSGATNADDFSDLNTLASAVKPSKTVRARNPLYDRVRRAPASKVSKATEDVEVADATSVKSAVESVFSPERMLDLMEEVAKKVNETEPSAQEALLLVQYQMCLQLAAKCQDDSVVLKPKFITRLVQYTLEVARKLNQKKHFDKVAGLFVALNTLEENPSFAKETLAEVSKWQGDLERYRKRAESAQEIFEKLQTQPDDPKLNTNYAMWLWSEKKDFGESLPYLEKCQYKSVRTAAQLERIIMQNAQYAQDPRYILQMGDRWWGVAEAIKEPNQKRFVMEHARDLYRKVDRKLLNEQQQLRIASLGGSVKM